MKTIMTIKAWRRPEYFRQMFEALAACPGATELETIVTLDFCHPSIQKQQVEIIENSVMKDNTTIVVADTPMGCAGSTIWLLNEAFEERNADAIMHLEDDSVPAQDYLQYMYWALETIKDDDTYFAVCPYTRRAANHFLPETRTLEGSYTRAWFEASGGFGITRNTWEYIQSRGGMFGTHSINMPASMKGAAWKSIMPITNHGSWAWPFNRYFRDSSSDKHLCIYPEVNRTENIGAEEGVFCPGSDWHAQNMANLENWIGHPQYNKVNFTTFNYTLNPISVGAQ